MNCEVVENKEIRLLFVRLIFYTKVKFAEIRFWYYPEKQIL